MTTTQANDIHAVPSAVCEWFRAYRDYVQALERYNARVKVAREAPLGSVDCNYEFQAYSEAQNKAHRLVHPMYEALAALQSHGDLAVPALSDEQIDAISVACAGAHICDIDRDGDRKFARAVIAAIAAGAPAVEPVEPQQHVQGSHGDDLAGALRLPPKEQQC